MRVLRAALLTAGLLAAKGCAGIPLTVAALTTGVGVDQMANGVAYKTYPLPTERVRRAALEALDRMAIAVVADSEERTGWRIQGATEERRVNIELEPVTSETTRMRVVVHKGSMFSKDSETGRMIVVRTSEALDEQAAEGGS